MDFTSTDGEKKHQHMVSWVCPCGFVEWGPMNNGYPELYDISWVKGVILNHGPWGVPCFQATSLATIHDEVLVVSSRSLVFHGFFVVKDHIIPVLGGSSLMVSDMVSAGGLNKKPMVNGITIWL